MTRPPWSSTEFRERSHQADGAAAIDQADAVFGQDTAEAARGGDKGRVGARPGGAIDANRFDSTHRNGCGHRRAALVKARRKGQRDATVTEGDCLLENFYMNRALDGPSRPVCPLGLLMTDGTFRSTRALKREISSDGGGSLLPTLIGLWPYIWPSEPARPEAAGRDRDGAAAARQARHHRGAVHLQMGDRCAGRAGQCAGRVVDWLVWVLAAPILMTVAYGGVAHPDGGAHPDARRRLRQGVDECGAPARLHGVRAHAPAVAALPSRAQDRRADARARTRPQRHRDHRAHGDHAGGADGHRARADRRRAALPVRLALRGGHHRDGRSATRSSPISRPSGASASAAA